MTTCVHCGKPLGSDTMLCFSCRSEGIVPEAVVDVDNAVRERVERYFIIAAVRCAECGEIHGTVTVDGTEHTAADFGIESVEQWQRELDKEEAWMRDNREAVNAALFSLAEEWPQSVTAVRETVL